MKLHPMTRHLYPLIPSQGMASPVDIWRSRQIDAPDSVFPLVVKELADLAREGALQRKYHGSGRAFYTRPFATLEDGLADWALRNFEGGLLPAASDLAAKARADAYEARLRAKYGPVIEIEGRWVREGQFNKAICEGLAA